MAAMRDIAANLEALRHSLEQAARAAGREAEAVRLIAASKAQPHEALRAALEAGHRHFGENRVQEAQARWPALKDAYPDVVLRLIGPLQSNKVADAVGLFDAIDSIDRPKIAGAIAKESAKQGRRPECLIQVNTGEEPQKAGVSPGDLPGLLDYCRQQAGLPIAGLMCIPPAGENPAPHFALLVKLADRYGLAERSMGMSGDYETAARFGATMVRVGSGIFGERAV